MRFFAPIAVCLSLCLSAVVADTISIAAPATKDATILRSTTSCPDCPERDCYKCTLGSDKTFKANTGGLAYVRSLVGFQIPARAPVSKITKCGVQFPAFIKLYQFPVNVTFSRALSSDWDEATVNGDNAPESGAVFTVANVGALENMGPVDVTPACKAASEMGEFSIYVGTQSDSIEIWSKDSGNPAILHIDYTTQ